MSIRRVAYLTAVILGLSSLACGFLEDTAEDNADVTITVDVPAEFTVDGNQICQNAGSYDCSKNNYQQAPSDQELPPIEFSQDIDVRDHTDRDIEKYTGNFKKITIDAIKYKTENNTLSFNLPQTELHMGPHGTGSSDAEQAFKLTTLDTIPAGENVDREAEVSDSAEDKASPLFKELKFAVIPRLQPLIKKGQDIPPHGTADMTVTFQVKFVANPVTAASN